jgi:hypothetical protein
MDGLGDVIELHAAYGFKTPIVIDLETVNSDWLDAHCDVVGFARSKVEIPPGQWLACGFLVEISETRLVARHDERAVRTLSRPIAVHFTRAEGQNPSIRWEWANTGDYLPTGLETTNGERRDLPVRDLRSDLARQTARHPSPRCRSVRYAATLDVELANQPGRQRHGRKREDLRSSPQGEWATQV